MKNLFLLWSCLLPIYAQAQWEQLGPDFVGTVADDQLGYSVALSADGNRLAIGLPYNDDSGVNAGQVRIFKWSGSQWQTLGTNISGAAAGDRLGAAVALSADGNRLAVGAPYNDSSASDAGQVKVYTWSGSQWQVLGTPLDGLTASDYFGWDVALSDNGNRLAISAPYYDSIVKDAGQVTVYAWSGDQWQVMGTAIDGLAGSDYFGTSLSLSSDGNRLAVGAPFNDSGASDAGQVRIFEWSGLQWQTLGTSINGTGSEDEFGDAVALSADGNRLAIGAPYNDSTASDAGQVRIFEWTGSQWQTLGSNINGAADRDYFGSTVALSADGSRLAVGAPYNDSNGTNAGQVSIYHWLDNQWQPLGMPLDGANSADQFGSSISLSATGSRLAIGAPYYDNNGTNAGQVRVFDGFKIKTAGLPLMSHWQLQLLGLLILAWITRLQKW